MIEDILGPDAPDLASVGAILTHDVALYEQAKLRLLNGAHSAAVPTSGLLLGHPTTAEAMEDARLAGFVERLMREDLVPTLRAGPALDVASYIASLLERFRNPAVQHGLYKIVQDTSTKLPYRFIEPIAEVLQAGGSIGRLAIPPAAWMRFAVAETRAGRALEDPLADKLAVIARACTGEATNDVPRFLALREVFPQALAADPHFVKALGQAYEQLGRGEVSANRIPTPPTPPLSSRKRARASWPGPTQKPSLWVPALRDAYASLGRDDTLD